MGGVPTFQRKKSCSEQDYKFSQQLSCLKIALGWESELCRSKKFGDPSENIAPKY